METNLQPNIITLSLSQGLQLCPNEKDEYFEPKTLDQLNFVHTFLQQLPDGTTLPFRGTIIHFFIVFIIIIIINFILSDYY